MSQVGAPKHDPIPIGEIAAPAFARVPDPSTMFAVRAGRLRTLANGHELRPYLTFLARLNDAQHYLQEGLPPVELPTADALARAREFAMPPLDRSRFTADVAFETTWQRFLALLDGVEMPDAARGAVMRVRSADAMTQTAMLGAVLADSVPIEALSDHVFAAAALQAHFARLAAGLDATQLVPVGDGACPACAGAPVSSLVVGWAGAHGTRFCACSLCGTLWNYPRIKCTLCGSTKGIAYEEVDGAGATVKAETCTSCRGYVKILHQHKDPALEPVADDVGSLSLDLLVREAGYRRGAVNPFLLGY